MPIDATICRLHHRISKRFFSFFSFSLDLLQKRMRIDNSECYMLQLQNVFTINLMQNRIYNRSYLTELQKFSFIHSFVCDHCNCTTMITDDFATTVMSTLRFFGPCICMAFARCTDIDALIVTDSAKLQCISVC